MKFRTVLLAAVLALSVVFPSAASAKLVSAVWTCNSDGFLHVVMTFDDGSTQEWITKACGPDSPSPIAMGGGFTLLFSESTRISERGQAFLDGMEAGEAISSTRVRVRDRDPMAVGNPIGIAIGTHMDPGSLETIHLRSDEVGPRLTAFFTRIDRDWNGQLETPLTGGSIFDRWGNHSDGGVRVPVPGDMGISVLFTGLERNARQSCRDQDGFWRQGSAREWGCWTTAR